MDKRDKQLQELELEQQTIKSLLLKNQVFSLDTFDSEMESIKEKKLKEK